jgi:hypothetical protein
MVQDVINVKEFDISKVSFGDIKKINDKGGKYISMYYDKSPFVIQTPQSYAPFGVNVFTDVNDNSTSHSLELSFKEKESRETLQLWYGILEQIDQKVLETVLENSQAWIRKPKNKDVVDALFTRSIRIPTDRETGEVIDKWPATYRLKMPKDNKGQFRCVAYDENTKDEVPLEGMIPKMKGAKVTAIATCGGIWVAGGKFGCSWKAQQLMIKANTGISKFAFRDILEDKIGDSRNVDSADAEAEDDDEEVVAEVNEVETSDDEAVVEEEESEEDEPPVVVKKKSRAKVRA